MKLLALGITVLAVLSYGCRHGEPPTSSPLRPSGSGSVVLVHMADKRPGVRIVLAEAGGARIDFFGSVDVEDPAARPLTSILCPCNRQDVARIREVLPAIIACVDRSGEERAGVADGWYLFMGEGNRRRRAFLSHEWGEDNEIARGVLREIHHVSSYALACSIQEADHAASLERMGKTQLAAYAYQNASEMGARWLALTIRRANPRMIVEPFQGLDGVRAKFEKTHPLKVWRATWEDGLRAAASLERQGRLVYVSFKKPELLKVPGKIGDAALTLLRSVPAAADDW